MNNLDIMVPNDKHKIELFTKCNPKLVEILVKLHGFCLKQLPSPKGPRFPLVTCTWRSLAEQKAIDDSIVASQPNYKPQGSGSLHVWGNALDLSVKDQFGKPFDDRELAGIITFVDETFPYNYNRISSIYRHVGTADHLHVQVNMRQHGSGCSPE